MKPTIIPEFEGMALRADRLWSAANATTCAEQIVWVYVTQDNGKTMYRPYADNVEIMLDQDGDLAILVDLADDTGEGVVAGPNSVLTKTVTVEVDEDWDPEDNGAKLGNS